MEERRAKDIISDLRALKIKEQSLIEEQGGNFERQCTDYQSSHGYDIGW